METGYVEYRLILYLIQQKTTVKYRPPPPPSLLSTAQLRSHAFEFFFRTSSLYRRRRLQGRVLD